MRLTHLGLCSPDSEKACWSGLTVDKEKTNKGWVISSPNSLSSLYPFPTCGLEKCLNWRIEGVRSFTKHLLTACSLLGTLLGTGDSVVVGSITGALFWESIHSECRWVLFCLHSQTPILCNTPWCAGLTWNIWLKYLTHYPSHFKNMAGSSDYRVRKMLWYRQAALFFNKRLSVD